MNQRLGWCFGVVAVLIALTYVLLPSQLRLLDALAAVGYLAAGVLLLPPTRAWFVQRVLKTTWDNDTLLRYIFLCVVVGACCAYFAERV